MNHEDKIKNAEDRLNKLKTWDEDRQEKKASDEETLRIGGRIAIETMKSHEKETEIERAYDMVAEIERMQNRIKDKHDTFLDYMKLNGLTIMFQGGGQYMEIYPINGPSASKFKMMAYDHGLKSDSDIMDFIEWVESGDNTRGGYKDLFDELKKEYGHVEVKAGSLTGYPVKLIVGNVEVCEITKEFEELVYLDRKISII